jgi:hypothetical protein
MVACDAVSVFIAASGMVVAAVDAADVEHTSQVVAVGVEYV